MNDPKTTGEETTTRLAGWVILGASIAMPVTIAISESLVFLAVALWLYGAVRGGDRSVWKNPLVWPLLAFSLVALAASAQGLHPAHSLNKCHRFILMALALAIPACCRDEGAAPFCRGPWLVVAFVAGSSLLAVYDLFRVPLEVASGRDLFDTGNMRDPQFYLVTLCFLLGAGRMLPGLFRRWLYVLLVGLNGMGMILHFKRGVWIAFLAVLLLLAVMKRRWSILAAMAGVVLLLLAVPGTRERIMQFEKEGMITTGGRLALWTEVAPDLLRDHPFGVGFKGTTHQDLRTYSRNLQPNLDHLHSNPLQVAAETGWLGLAVWIIWIGMVFWLAIDGARGGLTAPETRLAQSCLLAFAGLMLNGLVEYNFGDTEIMMVMGWLMGLVVLVRPPPSAAAP